MRIKNVRLTETQIAFLVSLLEGFSGNKSQTDEADAIIAQLRRAEVR